MTDATRHEIGFSIWPHESEAEPVFRLYRQTHTQNPRLWVTMTKAEWEESVDALAVKGLTVREVAFDEDRPEVVAEIAVAAPARPAPAVPGDGEPVSIRAESLIQWAALRDAVAHADSLTPGEVMSASTHPLAPVADAARAFLTACIDPASPAPTGDGRWSAKTGPSGRAGFRCIVFSHRDDDGTVRTVHPEAMDADQAEALAAAVNAAPPAPTVPS